MRTRSERRNNNIKKFKRRLDLTNSIRRWYVGDGEETLEQCLKRKSDIPHSTKSDWWNGRGSKKLNNKRARLKGRRQLKEEI